MEIVKLKATVRDQFGKGASRRIRASEGIPAVVYGKGTETTALVVSPRALNEAIATEFGPNRLIEIEIENKGALKVLLKEFQRHPVTRRVLHADFRTVDDQSPVVVQVPLKLVGKAKGLVMGGTLRQVFRLLPVRCLPGNIPASIEYDVSNVDLEETVSVGDLELTSGVEVLYPKSQTIGGVYGARRKPGSEDEDAAPGAKPEAAAPPAKG